MIIIEHPHVVHKEDKTSLCCRIKGEYLQDNFMEIWFTTDKEYGAFFVDEVADAFLLACLLPAIKYGEDIRVNAPVSEKLLFHLKYGITYLVSKSYQGHRIEIMAEKSVKTEFKGRGVGCGCSLGIDSLAAIFTHSNTPQFSDYQITHLTYFNVGSHGYKNLESTNRTWKKDMVAVEEFASILNLPVVKIESNVWKLFPGFNFDQSGNFINMSTVLTMQKLFGRYLYGSNYPMDAFHFTDVCSGYFESVMIPLLSTESTELIVANADMARSDKTQIVANNPLSRKSLYVCWKELIVNNDPNSSIAKIKDKFLNCTRCEIGRAHV